MNRIKQKRIAFERRRSRSKAHAVGHPHRLRLVVYRSNRNIGSQIVDDRKACTLVSASSLDRDLAPALAAADSKVAQARVVGAALAKRSKKQKIGQVVFDRNGYPYHGRVKALAEAARAGELEF